MDRISESQYTSEMYSEMKLYFEKRKMSGGVLLQPSQPQEEELSFDLLIHGNWVAFGLQIKAPENKYEGQDIVFDINQVQFKKILQKNKNQNWLFYCFPTFQEKRDILNVVRDHIIIVEPTDLIGKNRVKLYDIREKSMSWGLFIEKLLEGDGGYGFQIKDGEIKSTDDLMNFLVKKLKEDSPDLLMFVNLEENKYLVVPKELILKLREKIGIIEKIKIAFSKKVEPLLTKEECLDEEPFLGTSAAAPTSGACSFWLDSSTPTHFEKNKNGRIILMRVKVRSHQGYNIFVKDFKFYKFGSIENELIEEIGISVNDQIRENEEFFVNLDNTIQVLPYKQEVIEIYCILKGEVKGTIGIEIRRASDIELVDNSSLGGSFPIKSNLITVE